MRPGVIYAGMIEFSEKFNDDDARANAVLQHEGADYCFYFLNIINHKALNFQKIIYSNK